MRPDGSKVTFLCPLGSVHLLSLAGVGERRVSDLKAFPSTLRAAEEPEHPVCSSRRTYFGTDVGFFHSCNHVFASFASSAEGKLLSWQHLSLWIMEAVTGEKGFFTAW